MQQFFALAGGLCQKHVAGFSFEIGGGSGRSGGHHGGHAPCHTFNNTPPPLSCYTALLAAL